MGDRTWRRTACAVLVVLACRAAPAGAADAPGRDAVAPAGCWYMEDGCASRTAATATEGVPEPDTTLWTFEAPAGSVLEEAPRVWGTAVVVAAAQGPDRRTLHVLRAHDGRPLVPARTFETSVTLRPCLWEDRILVRSGPSTLTMLRVRGGDLVTVWEQATAGRVFDLLLYEDAVFAHVGEGIRCWSAEDGAERWSVPGSFRGRLTLADRELYALEYDDAGNSSVVILDTWLGRRRQVVDGCAHVPHGTPAVGYGGRIVVLDGEVFVHHETGLSTASGAPATTQWFHRQTAPGVGSALTGGGLLDWHQVSARAGAGWLTVERDAKAGLRLRRYVRGQGETVTGPILATERENAHFLSRTVPFTVAGRIVYVGGQAFHADTFRVTWESSLAPRLRPVPTRDALLVVPDATRLVALTAAGAAPRGELFFRAARESPGTPGATLDLEGHVLLRDDTVCQGPLRLDVAARTVAVTVGRKKTRTVGLDDVLAILDAAGGPLYTFSAQDTEWAVDRIWFFEQAEAWKALAKDAYKAFDPQVMQRMIHEALERGVPEKALKLQIKQQRALVDRPRKADAARLEDVLTRERALRQEAAEKRAAALEGLLDDPRPFVRRAFVERVLERAPDDPGVRAFVRARIPDFVKLPDAFDVREWMDIGDVLERVHVKPVVVEGVPPAELSPGARELAAARHYWRKDLIGLESDQLLVMTSLERPRHLAVCLAMGEMVCNALEDAFGAGEKRRDARYPLVLQLFENREEYKRYQVGAQRLEKEERERRDWSAGHYDEVAGVSRIWLAEHPGAFDDLRDTYAHELTHHWMRERCPLFSAHEAGQGNTSGGYWLVEGLAVFVEHFRWNLAGGTWDAFNPRAAQLEAVGRSEAKDLLPWKRLFDVSSKTFDALDGEARAKVPQRWRLGWYRSLSERDAFYQQAGASVFYLFHHSPETRAALLAYARDVYTGALPANDGAIRAHFGVEPEELGRRVVDYARKQLAGR